MSQPPAGRPIHQAVGRALLGALVLGTASAAAQGAERIDHAGRILGPAPTLTTPLQFDTAAADAVVGAMQVVPRDNPWVEDVSLLPRATDSDAMIARIIADTEPGFTSFRCWGDLNYVLVPSTQPRVDVDFVLYPESSDDLRAGSTHIGSWPIPGIAPIEGWPWDGRTLDQAQRAVENGDRHASIVMPGVSEWDAYQIVLTANGWQAGCGAKFPLTSNALRPDGWTSADAAGLALFPGIVRYDECVRGEIDHALRLCVAKTRRAHIYPATHDAGATDDATAPAMGQRLRLKSTWTIPSGWNAYSRAVARALMKYGLIVADNSGGPFATSHTPDPRFGASDPLHEMQDLPLTEFEVVQATGATGGPRSPGAPTCDAGADAVGTTDLAVPLHGAATGTNLITTWYAYDRTAQPGTVRFDDAHALVTNAHFSDGGTYTVMLKAEDRVHTPAFDALAVTIVGGGGGGGGSGGSTTSGSAGGARAASSHHKSGCGSGSGAAVALTLAVALTTGRRRRR